MKTRDNEGGKAVTRKTAFTNLRFEKSARLVNIRRCSFVSLLLLALVLVRLLDAVSARV